MEPSVRFPQLPQGCRHRVGDLSERPKMLIGCSCLISFAFVAVKVPRIGHQILKDGQVLL